MDGETFGAFIRAERESKLIARSKMADLLGVSGAHVSKIEQG